MQTMPEFYELRKIKVGAEIRGLNLHQPLSAKVIEQIKKDVTKYKLLVIKQQGVIHHERQIEITEYFGEVETAGFDQHGKSPHRAILRVSNDEDEGFSKFGTAGIHIDGSFMEYPNSHSIYHIIHTPAEGATVFVDINRVLEDLPSEQMERWERLYIVKIYDKIRGYTEQAGGVIHPLVYPHPLTKQQTMCLHLGKTACFMWDLGTPNERRTKREETRTLVREIDSAFRRNGEELLYYHKWESGDFIISDNLAVAHLACPETQFPREQIGLRVMHRTIVKGTYRPVKCPIVFMNPSDTPPQDNKRKRKRHKCSLQ